MTSLSRMLAILDLFTEETPAWTAEDIIDRLGYSRPTGYRYVRELCSAGLLRRGSSSTYLLGTRIIELDYQIRVTDPMLVAGRRIMHDLAARTGYDVMLAGIYDGNILTIHQEHGSEGVGATFGRGRQLPLFRGTLSKVVLAGLPRARQRRLYESHAQAIAKAKLGQSWDEFAAALKGIRAAGHCVTLGELDPGLVGISVPVRMNAEKAPGALALVMSKQRYATLDVARVVDMLQDAAAQIESAVDKTIASPASKRGRAS